MNARSILLDESTAKAEFCTHCDAILDGTEWRIWIQNNGNAPVDATDRAGMHGASECPSLCEDCADEVAGEFEDRDNGVWSWYEDQFDNGEVHS